MKGITEDYVSYEIAKLLKEKLFDENCHALYDVNTKQIDIKNVGDVFNNKQWKNYISAPTQSLACKWLREVHKIHIEIYRTACGYLYIISNIPYGTDLYNPRYGGDDENSGQWTTCEKAVEAAILYVLKNMI